MNYRFVLFTWVLFLGLYANGYPQGKPKNLALDSLKTVVNNISKENARLRNENEALLACIVFAGFMVVILFGVRNGLINDSILPWKKRKGVLKPAALPMVAAAPATVAATVAAAPASVAVSPPPPVTAAPLPPPGKKRGSANGEWFILGASVIGKSHITAGTPCQDNHSFESSGNGWGINIVCDGAGSAVNSHFGSEYVAKTAALDHFKAAMAPWQKTGDLPSEVEWDTIARDTFRKIYFALLEFALSQNYPISSLACTVIVLIYSPKGMLVTHIGDGRAGYCNEDGYWLPLITPHKGEESNSTIFITSSNGLQDEKIRMSGVSVPESRVIRKKPIAFTLMSDGCEAHSFESSHFDEQEKKWTDPNRPYPKFFNPIVEGMRERYAEKVPVEDIRRQWENFLIQGTPKLKEESDDKTMILGILI